MRAHPITLAFDNPQTEKSYQESYFRESLSLTRLSLAIAAALYALFGLLDYVANIPHLHFFLILRFVFVVPLLLFIIGFSYSRYFYRYWQSLLFTAFVVAGTGISLMIVLYPENASYFGGLMLIFLAGYSFIRLRFLKATLAGWITLLIFNILAAYHMPHGGILLISYNFFYVSANIIGMAVVYHFETNSRKNFILNQQLIDKSKELEEVNKSLEDRVEKRTKDLTESRERFKNLTELLPVMVYETNTEGVITYANQEAFRQLGYEKEELLSGSKNVLHLVTEEYQQQARKDFLRSLNHPDIVTGEYAVVRKDGTTFPVVDYSNPVFVNGRVAGLRSVAVNLSEQKTNEKLRTDVEVAQKSANFKQNFLANMSHEIRTPLTGIMGMVDLLSQTSINDTQRDYIQTISLSCKNLREIIDQVLCFSKIESGKSTLKKETFETINLCYKAQRFFESIGSHNVRFSFNHDLAIPKYIYGDEGKLTQVVNNLMSNAVKFTPSGSITLETKLHDYDKATKEVVIKVSLTDTGRGIHPSMQEKLFKPFSQLEESVIRGNEGTGLGLSICKNLAALHGGDIGLESAFEKGSTFWFTFKAEAVDEDSINLKKYNKAHTPLPNKLKILLAEDKKINQKVIRLMLNSLGHEVVVAENGEEAMEMFDPRLFDLVLMDIQMPVMDGLTATRNLKKMYKNLPPIVGLSANAFEGDREKYMDTGMDEYVNKPVTTNDFINLVERLFPERA